MSDNEELKKMHEQMEKLKEEQARKKAIEQKSLVLREDRVGRDYEQLVQNKKEIEAAKTLNFGGMSDEAIQNLVNESQEYLIAAQKSMAFICASFKGRVPFFKRNLLLIGADTGDGKSTAVANIVYQTLIQKNPDTGAPCRALILTNEEAPDDFYNRITCHHKGWKYSNHDQFNEEQRAEFAKWLPIWAKGGRLNVIGDVYEGVPGCTTTVEGIQGIFENLIATNQIYDVVLIDYYQNVRFSKLDPKLDEFSCQRKLSSILDSIKLRYPGAIVVMAQMKRLADEEDSTPFNVRIKGAKIICDKATFITELIPERKYLRSRWKIWKSRFTDSVGDNVLTGYDKGKFVDYSKEFQAAVAQQVNQNLTKELADDLPESVLGKKKKKGEENE